MKKLNIYTIFYIFFISSFLGVIIEVAFWFLKTGLLERRSSLVYGPFNLIYGVGAVLITLFLYKIDSKKVIKIFLISFLVGSSFEYLCSYIQELLFGTTSWDYSNKILNINGRISIVYSIFWGLLGIIWMSYFYPFILRIIDKIKYKKIIVWIGMIFLIFNIFMSYSAAKRGYERYLGIEAQNKFEIYLDKRFDNEKMEELFPNAKRK